MKTSKKLVMNDQHWPYHDPRALEICVQIAEDEGVDEIIINGDLADFYSINMHSSPHPEVVHTLEDELCEVRMFLEYLRSRFPKIKIMYIMGNHEDRLERFVLKHTKVFHNILRFENQLMLDNLKIDWIPYNQYYEVIPNKLRVQHSPPSYGVNGARTSLLKKLDCSYIYGCTHRMQHACQTTASGEVVHAWFNGWLGSTTLSKAHKRVFSYAKGHENWQQCAGIIEIYEDKWWFNQFAINEGFALYNGKVYKSEWHA
jgi:predicted phosphodiesterase